MLIEKKLEELIGYALNLSGLTDCQITLSRGSSNAGHVKGEVNASKGSVIAVATGLRSNDDFSLPTVNVSTSIAISTRGDMNATGAAHETNVEAVLAILDEWHYDGEAMSTALSFDGFFAAALRMDGSSGKTYSAEMGAWVETISFTIRGTVVRAN